MVQYVSIEADAEEHGNCIRCKGTKKHVKILRCANDECNKICHLKCRSTEFNANYPKFQEWFCSPECGTMLPVIDLSLSNAQETEARKKLEHTHELMLAEKNEEIKELTEALQTAMERSNEKENENDRRTEFLNAEIDRLRKQLSSQASEPQKYAQTSKTGTLSPGATEQPEMQPVPDEVSTNAREILKKFNSSLANHNVSTPHAPSEHISRSTRLNERNPQTDLSMTFKPNIEGGTNATLVARERVRLRRETDKAFKSLDPHVHRSDKDLNRLKLARQHLDELTKFKGDQLQWIAFEEEVYTTWDAGEFTDYEMIKKLRKALDDDAKNYVKLAINAPEANPEFVMETLRRKYYHPNEAVANALREITAMEPVRKKVRKLLEKLLTAVENYIHTCNLVKIQQQLNERVVGDVETKLPNELRADWNKLIRTGVGADGKSFKGHWMDFWQFLRDNVEDLPIVFETLKPSTSRAPFPPRRSQTMQINGSKEGAPKGGRNKASQSASNPKSMCPYDDCDKGRLYQCQAFWQLPYEDKMKFIKERKLCKKCVNSSSHVAKDCPLTNLQCRAENCQDAKGYSTVLHPPNNLRQAMMVHSQGEFTAFQVVPIVIYDKQKRPIKTLAFLDGGSDTTIMTSELFDKLQLASEPYCLDVGWCAAGVSSVDKASQIDILQWYN